MFVVCPFIILICKVCSLTKNAVFMWFWIRLPFQINKLFENLQGRLSFVLESNFIVSQCLVCSLKSQKWRKNSFTQRIICAIWRRKNEWIMSLFYRCKTPAILPAGKVTKFQYFTNVKHWKNAGAGVLHRQKSDDLKTQN